MPHHNLSSRATKAAGRALGSVVLALALVPTGCTDTSTFVDARLPTDGSTADGSNGDSYAGRLDYGPGSDAVYSGNPVVYAHTADTLYEVDPTTLKVSKVADFSWSPATDRMTDLAVDREGRMIGVSSKASYRVDVKTGHCQRLAALPRHFVGLSFVNDGGKETLVGITRDNGSVYRIDPKTGSETLIGTFGGGYNASGDIVSVRGFGTVATVVNSTQTNDQLVRVDPKTGAASLIGDTGFRKIWGLGFWKSKLYGFSEAGEFLLIDVKTAKGSLVSKSPSTAWWGAGVTTVAPVIK